MVLINEYGNFRAGHALSYIRISILSPSPFRHLLAPNRRRIYQRIKD